MPRKDFNLMDLGIEEETDPTLKLNSLLSVTVSTVMCVSAKCPLPKSNVEATKKFLSSVTDNDNKTPRNVKGFLSLLNDYTGPYEGSGSRGAKEKEKSARDKLNPDKEEKCSLENVSSSRNMPVSKDGALSECPVGIPVSRRFTRLSAKKTEKDNEKNSRKTGRSLASKSSPSKSTISSK